MRAIWITRHGGPEALEVRETPDPLPRPGELRIRVKAAGLNFSDVMTRQGLYPSAPKPPCVVGYEAAGIVDALGNGASGPPVGTRVVALVQSGAHADMLCAPAGQVLPIPDAMTFEAAAALPINYVTAFHMLFRVANLRRNERVLVHMAAGGVGIAALQLCRTVEGVVTYGTASASKHDVIRRNGCVHPIDYHTCDYEQELWTLTNGDGVDVVLDALGGKDWRKGYRLLRSVGRLVCFGFANMVRGDKRNLLHAASEVVRTPFFNPATLMTDNRLVAGVNVAHMFGRVEVLIEELGDIIGLFSAGKIKPHIDATFPFAEAGLAHRHIEQRKNVGKVLLVP